MGRRDAPAIPIGPGDLGGSGRTRQEAARCLFGSGEATRYVGVGFSRRGAAEKPKVGGKSMTAMTRRGVCVRACVRMRMRMRARRE
jgi:hypothetical protein